MLYQYAHQHVRRRSGSPRRRARLAARRELHGCHNPKDSRHSFEIDLAQTVPPGVWNGAYPIAGMNTGDTNIAPCAGCHAGGYALPPKALEFEEASAELMLPSGRTRWTR